MGQHQVASRPDTLGGQEDDQQRKGKGHGDEQRRGACLCDEGNQHRNQAAFNVVCADMPGLQKRAAGGAKVDGESPEKKPKQARKTTKKGTTPVEGASAEEGGEEKVKAELADNEGFD